MSINSWVLTYYAICFVIPMGWGLFWLGFNIYQLVKAGIRAKKAGYA